jgi:carbon-monoxide dehydrogenase medium subunit
MKPASFDYHRAESVEEVLDLLARFGEDCRVLAGGQSLVPLMNMRMMSPEALISINHCDPLDKIVCDGAEISIGARARQAAVGRHSDVERHCRLLFKAMPLVGTAANRNRGTVCGSLAHNDPLAELPAVAQTLDATLILNSRSGRRPVPASEFFISELMTCVEPDEFLEEVRFPVDRPNSGAAFVEVGVRAHGFAVAGVAAQVECDDTGRCLQARVSGMGFGDVAHRLAPVEDAARGSDLDDAALEELAAMARAFVEPGSDIHADAAYRRNLAGVLVSRALREAREDARQRIMVQ